MSYWHQRMRTPATLAEFRTDARASLHELAGALGFVKGTYTVKYSSSPLGTCGTITLRHPAVRVCIGHLVWGCWEIRIRPGGATVHDLDHFELPYLLTDIDALAHRVRRVMNTPAPAIPVTVPAPRTEAPLSLPNELLNQRFPENAPCTIG